MVKAAVIHEPGPPSVLKYEDVKDVPPLSKNEVKVRHAASGVNFVDCYIRRGEGGYKPEKYPHILGFEGAGPITNLGEDVSKGDYEVGDHVTYLTREQGAYSEERNVGTDRCINLSRFFPNTEINGVDDETAAAGLLKGMTAYMLLFHAYPVKAGKWVVVHAAAGGVGSLLTQWAKNIGAHVIGTVGSDEKAARAKANGCDHVIVYTRDDVVAGVKEATKGHMADVVYDAVGKATVKASLESLHDNGHLVLFGSASGPPDPEDLREEYLRRRHISVHQAALFNYIKTREEYVEFAQAALNELGSGRIRIPEITRFPLADAAGAHAYLEGRHNKGSVILVP